MKKDSWRIFVTEPSEYVLLKLLQLNVRNDSDISAETGLGVFGVCLVCAQCVFGVFWIRKDSSEHLSFICDTEPLNNTQTELQMCRCACGHGWEVAVGCRWVCDQKLLKNTSTIRNPLQGGSEWGKRVINVDRTDTQTEWHSCVHTHTHWQDVNQLEEPGHSSLRGSGSETKNKHASGHTRRQMWSVKPTTSKPPQSRDQQPPTFTVPDQRSGINPPPFKRRGFEPMKAFSYINRLERSESL